MFVTSRLQVNFRLGSVYHHTHLGERIRNELFSEQLPENDAIAHEEVGEGHVVIRHTCLTFRLQEILDQLNARLRNTPEVVRRPKSQLVSDCGRDYLSRLQY